MKSVYQQFKSASSVGESLRRFAGEDKSEVSAALRSDGA